EEIHVNASGVDDEGDTIGLSAGPDGKYGTYDDGLPATYEDFFMLCDYMVAHNVIPFTWSDTYGIAYMNSLLGYLRADYEGKDQLRLFYDPDGFVNEAGETINTAKNLIKFNGDEPIVDGINIEKEQLAMTNAKGYEMFRSAGFYYATYFLSQMMSDGSYLNWHYTGTSHTQAQEQFVKSEFYNGFSDAGNPVAFLVEGNYWYNEAKLNGIFDQPNNDGKTTDYGLLPVPKVDASLIGTRTTINIGLGNLVYVNANTSDDKMPLITEFLKFCYSDERLSDFTAITGMPKGLNYDLGDKRDCLSSYYKSVWDLTYNSNTDVVYAVSDNAIFLNTPAYFNDYPFRTTDQMYMLVEFTRNPSISASEVFKSLVDYRSQVAYNAEFFYVINGGKIN
ncbi:MAG: hypothetical protein MJ066_01530, partial [Clostridia bacterium]|nr:hypothetical protein [Clostridia bacterium]